MRDKLASKTRQSAGELWSGWAAGEAGERRRWEAMVGEVGGDSDVSRARTGQVVTESKKRWRLSNGGGIGRMRKRSRGRQRKLRFYIILVGVFHVSSFVGCFLRQASNE